MQPHTMYYRDYKHFDNKKVRSDIQRCTSEDNLKCFKETFFKFLTSMLLLKKNMSVLVSLPSWQRSGIKLQKHSRSENMQQIYRRTPMPKCDFKILALQLYWNYASSWVFSCKFAAYFQNTFAEEHLRGTASKTYKEEIQVTESISEKKKNDKRQEKLLHSRELL